jgi:hypothetical protein
MKLLKASNRVSPSRNIDVESNDRNVSVAELHAVLILHS